MSDFNETQNNEQLNPVEAMSSPISETQFISGVEPAKKKPVFLIVAIILVILAGGFAAAYNFIPWVKNNVKMLVSKPENYYLWVEEQNLEEMADKVSEGYGDLLKSDKTNSGEFELKADIDSTNVGALIEELTGSPLSDSGIVLPSNIAVKGGANVKEDGKMDSSFQINASDKTLATLNMYMQDGVYYYQVPELSPSYIAIDLNTMLESAYLEMDSEEAAYMQTFMETFTSFSTDPDAIKDFISEKELNELIVKYFTIVFENIDDVEIEKGVSCNVNGVKTEYNKLVAEVDMGAVYSIAKDVLKEAKKDKTIINLIEKFGLSKEDYVEAIDGILEQFGTLEVKGGDTMFTMNVYVDSNGKICGRDIEIPDEEDLEIGYMTAKDDSDEAFDVKIMSDGEGLQIVGSSEEKSGKSSGDVKLILAGVNNDGTDIAIPVSYKNCEVVNESKGYTKGEFSIDTSSFGGPVIAINLDSDGKSQTFKTDVAIGGTNYGSVSFTTSEKNTMDIPAFDSAQTVYQYTEDGAELQEYIMSATDNLVTLLNNVGSAFGVDGLGNIFGAALTSDPTGGISAIDPTIGQNTVVDPTIGQNTLVEPTTEAATVEDVKYDFSKFNYQINGQTVTIPSKIDGILDFVVVDKDKVGANDLEFFYSEDYTFGVDISNNTEADAAPKDCLVSGLSVSEGSLVNFSIDGITIGSNISDVAAKFGAKLEDPSSGYITIYDSKSDWNDVTFYYYNGKVNSFDIYIIEY